MDQEPALREAFEAAGYAVDGVSENRGRVSISLQETAPDADEVRRLVEEVLGESAVLGLDVTSEATAGDDAVGTVVSFQYRG